MIKSLLGGNGPTMTNLLAAANQPIRKVNAIFGLIVTKDQVVMAGSHARTSHLVKKLQRINFPEIIGPHAVNAHPKKAGKQTKRPLHAAKRDLSVVRQSLTSGLTLVISHPWGCPDRANQRVGHHGDLVCQKNAAVAKAMHPLKVVKAH